MRLAQLQTTRVWVTSGNFPPGQPLSGRQV